MNLKKSVKIALAMIDKDQKWLASNLSISEGSLSAMLTRNNPVSSNIEDIANVLDMKVSALIALGE